MLFDVWHTIITVFCCKKMDNSWKEDRKESLDVRERRRKEEGVVLVWSIVDRGCAHVWSIKSTLKL